MQSELSTTMQLRTNAANAAMIAVLTNTLALNAVEEIQVLVSEKLAKLQPHQRRLESAAREEQSLESDLDVRAALLALP